MFNTNKKLLLVAAVSSVLAAPSAMATNGMNLEGYGPIATGMGGASMAYDNGSAAVMNNPATLGLSDDGSRFDIAVGFLQPTIETSFGPFSADSEAERFTMPAMGWGKKVGKMAYGVGMFSQGGMGTEYAASTFMARGTGDDVRSEVGVGRLIAPLAYNVNDKLTVGGSLDFVWAGMDLKMALDVATAMSMVTSSNMLGGLGPATHVRLDFSDDSDFTGEAKAKGFGAKLGMVYKASDQLTIGAAYHSETSLGDMEGDASFSAYEVGGAGLLASIPGTVTVKDFQWPSMLAVGVAYKPVSNLMIAADIKHIRWADVMETFKVSFEMDAGPGYTDMEMPQEWDNQNAVQLGVQYGVNSALVLRGGLNLADNPVPDEWVNPLFPAIIENHVTLGLGYKISAVSTFDMSLVIAPEVEVTNSNTGQVTSHSQQNWQFMYSYRF